MIHLPDVLQPSSLKIDHSVIALYAELTNDFNPIHLNTEFAAKTAMGGVIAHGTMSIGLIWETLEKTLGGAAIPNIELDVRFIQPVRNHDQLIAGGRRHDTEPNTYEVWVRGEQDGQNRIFGTATITEKCT